MTRTTKWLLRIGIAYVLACLVVGWITTQFYDHHVYHAWRFTPDPGRALQWGLNVSTTAVEFPEQPSGRVQLSRGWIEWGPFRRMTIPFVPVLDAFYSNEHSLKLDSPEIFRVLHFEVAPAEAGDYSVRLADPDRALLSICSNFADRAGRIHCSVRVRDASQSTVRGHLVTSQGQAVEGTDFLVQVRWPR